MNLPKVSPKKDRVYLIEDKLPKNPKISVTVPYRGEFSEKFSEKKPSIPYRGATTVPYRGGFRGPYNGDPL